MVLSRLDVAADGGSVAVNSAAGSGVGGGGRRRTVITSFRKSRMNCGMSSVKGASGEAKKEGNSVKRGMECIERRRAE